MRSRVVTHEPALTITGLARLRCTYGSHRSIFRVHSCSHGGSYAGSGGVNVLGGWRWLSGTTDQNGPPFRDILASGIHVGMSSDGMQISTMSPWINLYYVVTGKNARGELINAGQTLGRNDAMRLYTTNNGWFLKAEDKLGTIEEGKLGDLVVISGDYFDSRAVPDESIKDLRSVLTIVGGKVVYNDLNGQSQDYWKAGMP